MLVFLNITLGLERLHSLSKMSLRKTIHTRQDVPLTPRWPSSLSNDHIQQDTEIQAWILDLHNNGYALREGQTDHGIPSSLTSIEQLTHLLTIVIFTCACQHAAVNFSQMDSLGFPPSSPALMRQPPPTEKGKLTMKDMMKSLPTKHQTGVTIVTLYDLTRIFPDEVNKRVFIHRQIFYFVDFFMSTCRCMPLNYLLWQRGSVLSPKLSSVGVGHLFTPTRIRFFQFDTHICYGTTFL